MKLSFHTSQHSLPGYTSLALGIAYTDGVLNEAQISRAIQLGIDSFVSAISESVVCNSSSRQTQGDRQVGKERTQRDSLDEILEQILCEGSHLSTV